MTETWRPIKGWTKYEVSNQGRIKSRNPRTKNSDGILTPVPLTNLYMKVTLCDGPDKRKDFLVHRLVAFAFKGKPKRGHEVNHINCNRQDNKESNLEWVSRSYNSIHAFKYGVKKTPGKYRAEKEQTKWQTTK